MRHKRYFYGADGGAGIEWGLNPGVAFAYATREAAQLDADTLSKSRHPITDVSGAKQTLDNFRVEGLGEKFIVCFDVVPRL